MLQVGTLTKDERSIPTRAQFRSFKACSVCTYIKKEKPKSAQQIHHTIAKQVKIEEHILALQ
jgi:hypothetical protein